MNVRRMSVFGSAVSLVMAAGFLFLASHGSAGANPELPYAPGEVLIGFHPNAAPAQEQEALNQAAARGAKVLGPKVDLDAGAPGVLRAATRLPVERAVSILRNHPAVAFAEPKWPLLLANAMKLWPSCRPPAAIRLLDLHGPIESAATCARCSGVVSAVACTNVALGL